MDMQEERQLEVHIAGSAGSSSRRETLLRLRKRRYTRFCILILLMIFSVSLIYILVSRFGQDEELNKNSDLSSGFLKKEELVILRRIIQHYKNKIDDQINEKTNGKTNHENKHENNHENKLENKHENKHETNSKSEINKEDLEEKFNGKKKQTIKDLLLLFENDDISTNNGKMSEIYEMLLNLNMVSKPEVTNKDKNNREVEHLLLGSIGKNENFDKKETVNLTDHNDVEKNKNYNFYNTIFKKELLENEEDREYILNNLKYINLFQNFTQMYDKKYKNIDEKIKRYVQFKYNYKKIEDHNAKNDLYKKGINQFSDYFEEELNKRFKKLLDLPVHIYKEHVIPLHEVLASQKNLKDQKKQKVQIFKKKDKDNNNDNDNDNDRDRETINEWNKTYSNKNYNQKTAFVDSKDATKETEETKEIKETEETEEEGDNFPPNLDYRNEGIVSDIKDQGMCGSCYSFGAVANIESMYAKKNKKLLNFSEQEIIDCSKFNYGCNGGHPYYVFLYVKNNGICLYDEYPYIGVENLFCLTDKCSFRQKITSVGSVEPDELIKALNLLGPLTVNVGAGEDFILYHSGIYNGPCSPVNHTVLLVGYGQVKKGATYNKKNKQSHQIGNEKTQNLRNRWNTDISIIETIDASDYVFGTLSSEQENREYEENDDDIIYYWIIKNSWGKKWGENGYMRIIRNEKGDDMSCGIGTDVFYPIL